MTIAAWWLMAGNEESSEWKAPGIDTNQFRPGGLIFPVKTVQTGVLQFKRKLFPAKKLFISD
jgi:hypothetical protein